MTSHGRIQGGIPVMPPGVLIHGGKTYWHKHAYILGSKKYVISMMEEDEVVVRSPALGHRNRYNYFVYTLMWDYEVDMRPDPQTEGSVVYGPTGKELEPLDRFYYYNDYPYSPKPDTWWRDR